MEFHNTDCASKLYLILMVKDADHSIHA